MRNCLKSHLLLIILLPILLGIDQYTKSWALVSLASQPFVEVLPFLRLMYAQNFGVAFSFLSHENAFPYLIMLSSVVSIILLIWYMRLPRGASYTRIGLVLILSGAIGNILDRIQYGYVIDFIDLFFKKWHFPTFNFADCYITLGALCVLVALWREEA